MTSLRPDDVDALRFERAEGFGAEHGVALRPGGVSEAPYDALNLGGSVGDAPDAVAANRRRFVAAIGADAADVCVLTQVHGTRIVPWNAEWFSESADGAVARRAGRVLVVAVADCWPVLLHDPATGAVGAAHAGWRGAVAGIAERLVTALHEATGTDPHGFEAALGPGICGDCYQVGADVADVVTHAVGSDASTLLTPDPTEAGRWRLDLEALNRRHLNLAGVATDRIHRLGGCTMHDERYFSHRRDNGRTGRHWAWIRAGGPSDAG